MAMVLYHKNKEGNRDLFTKNNISKINFFLGGGGLDVGMGRIAKSLPANARFIPIKYYYNKLLALFAYL